MHNKILSLLMGLLFITTAVSAQSSMMMGPSGGADIVVNNRVLAKVNGKAITVLDLMKKMDLIFYQEYPEYASNSMARHQFYTVSWKHVLSDLIDRELILADAEEVKMTISAADVRLELEQMFGPNVIANLDKAGLTMEEASKMISDDVLIRRMMFLRVNAKAMKKVRPQEIRKAYDEQLQNHDDSSQWVYHVVSIRDPEAVNLEKVANEVHALLIDGVDVTKLSQKSKNLWHNTPLTSVKVSEEYAHKESEMSPAYQEVLVTLKGGEFSKPVTQRRSSDNSPVIRIFYVKEVNAQEFPEFSIISNNLKGRLIQQESDKETGIYLKHLREHFGMHDDPVSDLGEFEPFKLAPKRR